MRYGIQSFILISSFFPSYVIQGLRDFNLFHTLCKNCYIMQMYTSIASIFFTNEECVMVDSPTKFAVNLRNIQGVMSIYSYKARGDSLVGQARGDGPVC